MRNIASIGCIFRSIESIASERTFASKNRPTITDKPELIKVTPANIKTAPKNFLTDGSSKGSTQDSFVFVANTNISAIRAIRALPRNAPFSPKSGIKINPPKRSERNASIDAIIP